MPKTYIVLLPVMFLWLAVSIVLGWGAVQDDSLIHLRYASNLDVYHLISYDGVHPDYGTSSLLYVALLAALRWICVSPDLARAVSSGVHLLLFAGLAWGFWRQAKDWDATARIAALTLLLLVVLPGAVRWLDDGMETGIVASFAAGLAWVLHSECRCSGKRSVSRDSIRYLAMVALGFFTVLLRTELSLVCVAGFLILLGSRWARKDGRSLLAVAGGSAHLLLGAVIAILFIFATMHTVLPDTALAKSHGMAHWMNPIRDTAVTLGGAMSFGAGLLIFWMVTFALVLLRQGISRTLLLANCLFPVVLMLASVRGQEIQGARYFAWTFFFAIVWNILELGQVQTAASGFGAFEIDARWLLYGFLVVLMMELPFEAMAMHRVLTRRAATMREFEGQHLEVLSHARGVASDIGYIGYFTQATLCDLAGLVNGRAAARLSSSERAQACVATDPNFLFVSVGQLGPLARYRDFSAWQVCGRYDFTNVSTPDSHYLIVRPDLAEVACRATGQQPLPVSSLSVAR